MDNAEPVREDRAVERELYSWDPSSYRAQMAREVPSYAELQDAVVAAACDREASAVLDLGIGSGLTARRIADRHAGATIVGIDADAAMLATAEAYLDAARTTLVQQRLEAPLPTGPFDVVVSMLAVHHLDAADKADLFRRVRHVLAPGGRFVLGDLVVPVDPTDVVTEIDGVVDVPDTLADQLTWCSRAGLAPTVSWQHRDLAVISATISA
jgi:tRNA (cmo5U34)-methyltransferase